MNKHKILTMLVAAVLALALVLPGVRPAQAAAPANDDFDAALVIGSLPFSDTQDTTDATPAGDDPYTGCWGYPQGTIWYAFTPSESILLRLDNTDSSYSTVISLYTGERGFLNQVTCASGQNVSLDVYAEAGITYYIVIGDARWYPYPMPGEKLTSVLHVKQIMPPDNDDFADAVQVEALPFTLDAELTAATTEINEPWPTCAGWYSPSRTVWYAYTPNESVSLMVRSWGWMSTFSAVYTGSELSNLDEVACRNYGDQWAFRANAGTTYYIQAGSMYNESGWLSFQLDVAPPPTADFSYDPWNPSIYDSINFWDSSNDPANVWFETFEWDFGDGSGGVGSYIAHTFAADGDYPVAHLVTTWDGRMAWVSKTVSVRTHDIAVTKFTVPKSASAGQTRSITVGLKNRRYADTATVELYKSTQSGYVFVGTLTHYVPVRSGNRTTDFSFSYTFSPEDARLGKVTFRAVAMIQGNRDALSADNEAISMPVKVGR